MISTLALALSLAAAPALAQNSSFDTPPNTFPHFYPGAPNTVGNFSDSAAWQAYYEVNATLPNVTFPLARSFAGNIPVDRPNQPNDTLFFWAFEKEEGSLTRQADENCTDPWFIWLNGGPGSSSMLGLLFENGPLHIAPDYTAYPNNFSWNTLGDMVWIDQPVGTGFSTASSTGYIDDEDQMGRDFLGFLSNLVQVFPSLAQRPLYLTGESYAGTYIPYIVKTYFGTPNPPVKLTRFAIGDGAIGDEPVFEDAPVMNVIETYPQLIDYDPDVYNYFKEQWQLCGYDVNLTYPQNGTIPTLRPNTVERPGPPRSRFQAARKTLNALVATSSDDSLRKRDPAVLERKAAWKRDLSGRANGTIDPWYECLILFELIDYAVNFTAPWDVNDPYPAEPGFDVYSIPDATDPEPPQDGSVFLNNPVVRAALHAPTSKNWSESINYPFESNETNSNNPNTNQFGDPSIAPGQFFTELAANASAQGVPFVIYSGNDDLLVNHFGSEITIQNTTFGGIQGFTRPPSTPWYGDDGAFAGIVHQERNLTYVLFGNAGHLVPQWQPARALTFLREFVLGDNKNGTVLSNGTVVGGEGHPLVGDVLPGEHNPIFTGSATTAGSTLWPSATIAAWDSFLSTATATGTANGTGSATATSTETGSATSTVNATSTGQ